MCGIAGFLTSHGDMAGAEAILEAMGETIAHRGPDDRGNWVDEGSGVAFVHRRLAIIDLSSAGHQPMASASGRLTLIFNGEIYNHRELRDRLERERVASEWRGHSDTEVLLAAIEAWGIVETLERLNGMFAFAVWDRQTRKLTLARDRAGEKPLYYGFQGKSFLFASELKALAVHPEFEGEINRAAVTAFMRFGYVPSPLSIWNKIHKLPPAHLLEIEFGQDRDITPRGYWNLYDIAAKGAADPFADTPELVDDLEALLGDAVGLRMEADVPLGAFLSGGIDSSVITALMQTQSTRPVRTFSIGFDAAGYDESGYARAVAEHLGTDHRELRVGSKEALAVIPKIPTIWDEPFADSSQIPTYLVNALAREDVTVALTGDGGDELFAGYNRHVLGARLWSGAELIPRPFRNALAAAIASPAAGRAVSWLADSTKFRSQVGGLSERFSKIAMVIGAKSPQDFYSRLVSQWPENMSPVCDGMEELEISRSPPFDDFRNSMLYLDTITYLPDDILAKVDRAGMATSLEGRIPFLDHRLIEFAWKVPLTAKIRNGRGKHILREVLHRHVPQALVDRPKAGFAIPIGDWLLSDLRQWAEDLLDPAELRSQGFLNAELISEIWLRFRNGDKSLFTQLWCVLMFQSWLRAQSEVQSQKNRAEPRYRKQHSS